MSVRLSGLINDLRRPIDARRLAWLRILLGGLLAYEALAILSRGDARLFSSEIFHLAYYGFGWVTPLSESGMVAVLVILALAGLCVAIGLGYRASTIVAASLWTYLFLIEKTFFLNHWYLIAILAWLLVAVPADGEFSLDNVLASRNARTTAPAWTIRIFQLQLFIVYVFAGIAKLNPDWLTGRTMTTFLADHSAPFVASTLSHAPIPLLMAVGSAAFDLCIAFLLFWRPARIPALCVLIFFHGANALLFDVGQFPLLGFIASFVFLRPDGIMLPAPWRKQADSEREATTERTLSPITAAILVLFFSFQLLFPLRHFLYKGDVLWTGEGYFFSWRMLARDDLVGKAELLVTDQDTGSISTFRAEDVLIPQQTPDVYEDPDMLLQVVRELERQLAEAGHANVSIRAGIPFAINGGDFGLYADPTVDLTKVERTLGHAEWLNDRP